MECELCLSFIKEWILWYVNHTLTKLLRYNF